MARSVSMQFRFLSRDDAKEYLRQFEGAFPNPRTTENYGDRVAAQRRLDYVTTADERAAARADAKRYGRPLKEWS